ncbi:hypothetical protein [Moraxella lacunata]|uniref:hypothetical protein n=1 Tax=Moraxella lacunata TaxID=477 RepID=UPI003EE1AAAD
MIEISMPVGTFLRSGLAVWEQESPPFREGRKSSTFIAITNTPTFLKIVMIKMSRFAWIIFPCQHLPFFRPTY